MRAVWTILAVAFLGCGSASSPEPERVPLGGTCATATDCEVGLLCTGAGRCVPFNCVDQELTGNETDIDCGGDCDACGEGQVCKGSGDCASLFCAAGVESNVCRDCQSDTDCEGAANTFCDGGLCKTRQSIGSSCGAGRECTSGWCVDGVCCDGPCDGGCERCGSSGVCAFIEAGGDSEGECPNLGGCDLDGTCNGAGGCRLASADASCSVPVCAGGTETGSCDGSGVCDAMAGCGPYGCNGTVCYLDCVGVGDAACASGFYCDGSSCERKQAQGTACTTGNQCQSGSCADGVCCNNACGGECMACVAAKTGGTDGTCAAVSAGSDPDNECPSDGTPCGRTGQCSGSSGCAYPAAGTVCAAASCSGAVATAEKQCNGSGSCLGGTQSCYPFTCNGTQCYTSCTTTAQCYGTGPRWSCVGGYCEFEEFQDPCGSGPYACP